MKIMDLQWILFLTARYMKLFLRRENLSMLVKNKANPIAATAIPISLGALKIPSKIGITTRAIINF